MGGDHEDISTVRTMHNPQSAVSEFDDLPEGTGLSGVLRVDLQPVGLEQYRIRWNHLIRGFAFFNKVLECDRRFCQRRTTL
jgi:hypothetical protein